MSRCSTNVHFSLWDAMVLIVGLLGLLLSICPTIGAYRIMPPISTHRRYIVRGTTTSAGRILISQQRHYYHHHHQQQQQQKQGKYHRLVLQLSSQPTPPNDEALERLGFTKSEIQRSREQPAGNDSKNKKEEPISVNVNLVENVDPVSLTAVGFGLIVINFFILANMGDGGIAGTLATIINSMNN